MSKIIIWLSLITSVFMASCFEDKGNYDYIVPNEVTIGFEGRYTVALGEPFHIVPELTFLNPRDSANFDYYWEFDMEQVSDKRDLDYTFTSCKNYLGTFYITERSTKIVTSKFFEVMVQSPYAKGWLILSDNGESSLSFLRTEADRKYTFFPDIYRQLYGESLGSEPIGLTQHFSTIYQQITVMQKGGPGGVELDGADLHKVIRTEQEFIGEVYPVGYDPVQTYYCAVYECILNRDGRLFNRLNETGIFQSCAYSDVPFQYEGVQPKISKVIAPKGLAYFMLMFDDSRKSFIGINTTSSGVGEVLPVQLKSDKSTFKLKAGDDLVYSGAYSEGYCSSFFMNVIKRDGGYRIQTCQVEADDYDDKNAFLVSGIEEVAFPASYLLNEDTKFHLLRTGTRLFFSGGSVLTHYTLTTGAAKDFCDFKVITGKDVEIVEIDSNPERTELAVALSDGSFYILDVSNVTIAAGRVDVLHHESGFGKIADIMFKYISATHYRDDRETLSGL